MSPHWMSAIGNHLWQSTLFAVIAGLLTLTLRRYPARVRHSVWLAASCKFLIPFSVLVGLGGQVHWRSAPEAAPAISALMQQVSTPVTPSQGARAVETPRPAPLSLPSMLLAIWLCGFLGIAGAWLVRWRRIQTAVRAASPLPLDCDIPVLTLSSAALLEPGIFGVFRPVLLLPDGILRRLTRAEFQSILAHELCHVRRRDNLLAAIHMFVETLFWFHPLVWWIGKRMVEERERACDEEVLRLGWEPGVYAGGILSVCKLYLESPLACVSGVIGSNLKKRMEAIMSNRPVLALNRVRKIALVGSGVAALVIPTVVGMVNAPAARAQTSAQATLKFDAASVKPVSVPDGVMLGEDGKRGVRKGSGIQIPRNTGGPGTDDPGRIHWALITLKELLKRAWDSYYSIEGPGWLDTQVVAVEATMPPDTSQAQFREMLRSLIIERFGLQYHAGKKEIVGYALMIAHNGPQLKESADQKDAEYARIPQPTARGKDGFPIVPPFAGKVIVNFGMQDRSRILAQQVTMEELARNLARELKTIISDETGLAAKYDVTLTYARPEQLPTPATVPEGLEPAPYIFAAVQSQLGLKLEPKKVPVDALFVDRMDKTPSGN